MIHSCATRQRVEDWSTNRLDARTGFSSSQPRRRIFVDQINPLAYLVVSCQSPRDSHQKREKCGEVNRDLEGMMAQYLGIPGCFPENPIISSLSRLWQWYAMVMSPVEHSLASHSHWPPSSLRPSCLSEREIRVDVL